MPFGRDVLSSMTTLRWCIQATTTAGKVTHAELWKHERVYCMPSKRLCSMTYFVFLTHVQVAGSMFLRCGDIVLSALLFKS